MLEISIGLRHAQHVLAKLGEHEIAAHRGDGEESRFAELALDVVLGGEAVPPWVVRQALAASQQVLGSSLELTSVTF